MLGAMPSRLIQASDVFALLGSTCAQGHLVPYLDAGMSAPMLNLWRPFVEQLEQYAQPMGMAIDPGASQETLEARAERAYSRIRYAAGHEGSLAYIRDALRARNS